MFLYIYIRLCINAAKHACIKRRKFGLLCDFGAFFVLIWNLQRLKVLRVYTCV